MLQLRALAGHPIVCSLGNETCMIHICLVSLPRGSFRTEKFKGLTTRPPVLFQLDGKMMIYVASFRIIRVTRGELIDER